MDARFRPVHSCRARAGLLRRLVAVITLGLAAVAVQAAAPATTTAKTRPDGEQVYARWCVHCHDSGRGNPGTDSLQAKYKGSVPAVLLERSDLTADAVKMFVRQGVLSMPPFRKTEITDEELAALAAYMTQKRPAPR